MEDLVALAESSVVRTQRRSVRVKTHSKDEWDMVMRSEEVLDEGAGRVLLVSHPDEDGWPR